MEKTAVQKLARVLRIMVTVLIVCNIIALILVPGMVLSAEETYPNSLWGIFEDRFLIFFHFRSPAEDDVMIPLIFAALTGWWECFQYPITSFYAVFLLMCGGCTLVILRQARRILGTILEGNPFQMSNAVSMKRAAVCCWVISGAALIRTVWELARLQNTAPLYTYNTLFIVVFLMAGLLFQVMSTLFRQAAELREDQDLTI